MPELLFTKKNSTGTRKNLRRNDPGGGHKSEDKSEKKRKRLEGLTRHRSFDPQRFFGKSAFFRKTGGECLLVALLCEGPPRKGRLCKGLAQDTLRADSEMWGLVTCL